MPSLSTNQRSVILPFIDNKNNTTSNKNNLVQIASNLWWNITALKAEIPHLLLSVLFAVDRNKTGKP